MRTGFTLGLFLLAAAIWPAGLHATARASQYIAGGEETAAIEKALNQFRSGHYYQGMEDLKRLGEAGHASAYYHLGEMHRLGVQGGAPKNTVAMYYRQAAEMGHETAARRLANFLYFEWPDDAEAQREALTIWLEMSRQNDPEAMYLLGSALWNGGAGFSLDPVRGYGLIRRASELGYGQAVESEILIAGDLAPDLRLLARNEAEKIDTFSLNDPPLALEAMLDSIAPAAGDSGVALHASVLAGRWTVQVGFPIQSDFKVAYMNRIRRDVTPLLDGLQPVFVFGGVRDGDETEVGLHHIRFGPLPSLQEAVTKCMSIKTSGHDCAAKFIDG